MDQQPEQSRPGYHWPTFDLILCGTMTDRERLGLPDRFVDHRFSATFSAEFDQLRGLGAPALAMCCEDPTKELSSRLAAGQLLALLGDPRIVTRYPAMITVPGGRVHLGLDPTDLDRVMVALRGLGLDRAWIAKECPRHAVDLKSYAIGKYPVTNQEYRDFLLATGDRPLPDSWHFRRFPKERSNHPVYSVSPEDADAYAAWLSRITGRRFRLPTESEWEFAAAGPDGLEFPWGHDFEPDHANTAETGLFQSSPVGVFVDGNSPFGLSDMAGNVEEYVSGLYTAYPGGAWVSDHLVEIHGAYRIARGGGFARFRDLARTRRRHGGNPRSVAYTMGFRLAEDIG
jgi:formylglycine-generating enzyme required for sulfatase activity